MEAELETGVFDEAIVDGFGSGSFDIGRKILSLAIMLGKEVVAPMVAARAADETISEKTVEHQVGAGTITEEDGIEAVADRAASAVVAVMKPALKTVVQEGVAVALDAAAGWVAIHCYPPLITFLPYVHEAGETVGRLLSEKACQVVETGVKKLAAKAFGWLKKMGARLVEKVAGLATDNLAQ